METPPAISFILQLGRRARQAENANVLGFIAVNESRQLLNYRQSAVWLQHKGVVVVSGLPATERDTPYTQWLASVCRSQQHHSEPALLNAHALPAELPASLANDWDDWLPAHALFLPLCDLHGRFFGLWMLAREAEWSDSDVAVALELAGIYAHAWQAFLPRITLGEKFLKLLGDRRRKQRIALALAVMLLFPVRLTVMAPAEVTPKDAFQVRAPLEGAVDMVHVRPNQPVKTNDPLFDLDTTSLRMRLSMARKAHEAATEEYRQAAQLAVSDDEKGRLEMSQRKGRMEEKAAELAYSVQLLDRIQVKAPRDGIAVFSDTADWIGKAVMVGERVMQIADPSRVEVAIRLPVANAIDIEPNAPVTLYLTTSPQFSYSAKLTYMAYRAEVTGEGIAAYKLKADFAAEEPLPRLGLTGTAKVYGGWVPFVYYLMRRPLAAARQWIGW